MDVSQCESLGTMTSTRTLTSSLVVIIIVTSINDETNVPPPPPSLQRHFITGRNHCTEETDAIAREIGAAG